MWQAFLDMRLVGYRYYIYLFLDVTIQILVPFFLVLISSRVVELLQSKVSISLLLSSIILWIGGILLYATLAGSLNPILLGILILTSIINCYAKSKAIKYQFEHMDKFWDNNSRFWYLKKESINTEKTKDIRECLYFS